MNAPPELTLISCAVRRFRHGFAEGVGLFRDCSELIQPFRRIDRNWKSQEQDFTAARTLT
jgi:hypothetical protein